MDAERLALAILGALWMLLGLLYGGIVWEIRKLRDARHRQANTIQWCVTAVDLLLRKNDIELRKPGEE